MHPIPSVIDLPSELQLEMDDENVSASTGRSGRGGVTLSDMKKRRNLSKNGFGQDIKVLGEKANRQTRQANETAGDGEASEAEVRRYDADGTLIALLLYYSL